MTIASLFYYFLSLILSLSLSPLIMPSSLSLCLSLSLSVSCSSQLFNHTCLMPKKEREGGRKGGTNGRRERVQKKELRTERERESVRAEA